MGLVKSQNPNCLSLVSTLYSPRQLSRKIRLLIAWHAHD